MNITVNPSKVTGTVKVPPSKSMAQRAVAAALLRNGKTVIEGYGNSNDEQAALNIIQQAGAHVRFAGGELEILSDGKINTGNENIIHCGESGLSARMFLPILALSENKKTITGSGSLLQRPFDVFGEAFPELGVNIKSNNGKLPIEIIGELHPENIKIDGSLSSQFLSGLLFAFAASEMPRECCIEVENLQSKPYIDLTLQVISDFGLNSPVNAGYRRFVFTAGKRDNLPLPDFKYRIEQDWSSASFLLVAGAIAGKITLIGMNKNSLQADRKILEALAKSGAGISVRNDEVSVMKKDLNAFQFDAADCPDLIPPLVALAAFCKGQSIITGAGRLIHKESNRAESIVHVFSKLNVPVEVSDDLIIIKGGSAVNGGIVDSFNDHRIAMSAAVTALAANEKVIIGNARAVNKSFPGFWNVLKSVSLQA